MLSTAGKKRSTGEPSWWQFWKPAGATLIAAIRKGDVAAVEHLLAKGAYPEAQAAHGQRALHIAAQVGTIEMLAPLVGAGAEVDRTDEAQNAPIHLASIAGSAAAVRELIRLGSDANLAGSAGATPLHFATEMGHRDVFDELIRAGASVDTKMDGGTTLLHCATDDGFARATHAALGVPWAPDKALDGRKRDMAATLLGMGANVNAVANGETPLHLATQQGKPSLVALLLDSGADVKARDLSGRTPLHLAVEQGEPSLVVLLLERGPDLEAKDATGRTPILCCANARVMKLLLDRGAAIDCVDTTGRSIIHQAAAADDVQQLQAGLSGGHLPDEPTKTLATPLHFAAGNGQVRTCQFLLSKGASIDAQDCDGRTPLWYAAKGYHLEAIETLLANGADPDLCGTVKHNGRDVKLDPELVARLSIPARTSEQARARVAALFQRHRGTPRRPPGSTEVKGPALFELEVPEQKDRTVDSAKPNAEANANSLAPPAPASSSEAEAKERLRCKKCGKYFVGTKTDHGDMDASGIVLFFKMVGEPDPLEGYVCGACGKSSSFELVKA